MRISDWSSDVCSSDLPGKPHRHLRQGSRRGSGKGLDRGRHAARLESDMAGMNCKLSGWPPLFLAIAVLAPLTLTASAADLVRIEGGPFEKIGRASGRERVCTEV